MKLGYRERITLLIVFVVLVFGVGIFALIKPTYEKLKDNEKKLEKISDDWDQQLLQFNRIPGKQEAIRKRFQEGEEISKEFTDEMTSVELDEFLRKEFFNNDKFQEDGVKLVSNFTVSDEQTTSMSYYYVTPNIVTYPLVEYADLDGSLAEATKKLRRESDVLSTQTVESAGSGNSTLTVRINREDTMALLDAVDEYRKKTKDAMLITGVKIAEIDFNENVEEAENAPQFQTVVDEDGNEMQVPATPAEAATDKDGKIVYPNFTEVTFNFAAYYMQEPTEPDVGPEYDENIWNGQGWRDSE